MYAVTSVTLCPEHSSPQFSQPGPLLVPSTTGWGNSEKEGLPGNHSAGMSKSLIPLSSELRPIIEKILNVF